MQVERKLEDLGAVKSYRTIYGRQQIGIRPVVSSWGTINGWLRTINTIHKQFRPFDRINTRVNVAGKALHGLVHAFFFDLLFGWRLWLWVELKKGDSLNIFYVLNLAGDEIWFLLTRKRFIWSNKPIMSDLFCIQPPYSFYSGTQRRLCEVTSQAAGRNGLCAPWYTFWIYI